MGNMNEMKVLNYLNSLEDYKDNPLKFFKNRFNTFDFLNKFEVCELKSRRCNHNEFKDTMIGLNKLARARNNIKQVSLSSLCGVEYKFYFLFKDGLYVWNYNDDEFTTRFGGRCDRGENEFKNYGYVPIEFLELISSTITS